MYDPSRLPLRVEKLEVSTGRRQPWKELAPADSYGLAGPLGLTAAQDGQTFAYSYVRVLSELYMVEGVK